MSHWARRGTDNMFYANGNELVPMSQDGANDEFIEAIQVFHGEMTCCHHGHKGGTPCDREFLMLPMLGLYQQIHAERNDERMKKIYDVIEPFLGDVFPATFQYTSDVTGTLTKPLFGDLIQAYRAKAAEESCSKHAAFSTPRRCMPCRHNSMTDWRPGSTCAAADMGKHNYGLPRLRFEPTVSMASALRWVRQSSSTTRDQVLGMRSHRSESRSENSNLGFGIKIGKNRSTSTSSKCYSYSSEHSERMGPARSSASSQPVSARLEEMQKRNSDISREMVDCSPFSGGPRESQEPQARSLADNATYEV
jgi:hypothetical protein